MTDRDPSAYLEKHKDDVPEEAHKAMKEFLDANELKLADRTVYDYLCRLNSMINKFTPEDFELSEPTGEEIKSLAKRIANSDFTEDTKQTYFKVLKKFYKTYKDGEYYELTDCFTVSGSSKGVERHMILSPSEIKNIINNTQNVRDRAFFRLLYECACTPGELLQAQVQDVDLEEEAIYIRGNKNHRSQTMELHNEGLSYLRDYLKSHPVVDDIFSTNSEDPLWIRMRAYSCKNCGESQTAHDDPERETCDNYEPKKAEEVGYRSFYKSFQRAVKESSVDRKVKMKYFRKSMLTRLCAENIGFEQLNNFARWVSGSTQAAHYVSLSNNKLRSWVRSKFKGEGESGKDIIQCNNCGARNPADSIECKKCHRPLNAPKSEKMRKADEIADKLGELDGDKLEMIKKNLDVLKNPQKMIQEEVRKQLEGKL